MRIFKQPATDVECPSFGYCLPLLWPIATTNAYQLTNSKSAPHSCRLIEPGETLVLIVSTQCILWSPTNLASLNRSFPQIFLTLLSFAHYTRNVFMNVFLSCL